MLLGVSSSCRFVRHRTCYCCYFTRNTKDVVRLWCDIILDKSPSKEYESEVRYNVNFYFFFVIHNLASYSQKISYARKLWIRISSSSEKSSYEGINWVLKLLYYASARILVKFLIKVISPVVEYLKLMCFWKRAIGRYTIVIFDFCAHKSKIPDVWAATVNLIYFSNKFQNIGRFISVSAVQKVENN